MQLSASLGVTAGLGLPTGNAVEFGVSLDGSAGVKAEVSIKYEGDGLFDTCDPEDCVDGASDRKT
eukprot:scaffold1486_cov329-Prasinococcus_capsulatus_cf.AAC.14